MIRMPVVASNVIVGHEDVVKVGCNVSIVLVIILNLRHAGRCHMPHRDITSITIIYRIVVCHRSTSDQNHDLSPVPCSVSFIFVVPGRNSTFSKHESVVPTTTKVQLQWDDGAILLVIREVIASGVVHLFLIVLHLDVTTEECGSEVVSFELEGEPEGGVMLEVLNHHRALSVKVPALVRAHHISKIFNLIVRAWGQWLLDRSGSQST